jgi:hypothetical protein
MNHNFKNPYFNQELSESDEFALEKQLHHDMIKNRYEKLLQKEGLYTPNEPILKEGHRKWYPILKVASILIGIGWTSWQVWKRQVAAK